MKERIAIIDGLRTPFVKAGTELKTVSADDLGAKTLRQLMLRSKINVSDCDEVILGNVAQPSNAANIARVSALRAGFPESVPAYTVQRNCASGMESISTAINKILAGQADTIVAGGTESMSNIPFLFQPKMKVFFERLARSKSLWAKLKTLQSFKFKHLAPVIGLVDGLTDPVCGQIMGITAENLAKEFKIGREEQDRYALESHKRAVSALTKGLFLDEIVPIDVSSTQTVIQQDNGPREDQSLEALAKLKPYFDRRNGTVTVGNACPITDGAAAVILKTESEAKRLGLPCLGFISGYAYAGLEPQRMGLGPVYATAKLFKSMEIGMNDIDLFEMNEAFAVQVLANCRAFASDDFSKQFLGLDKAIGEIDMDRLNVNGGAIALGHPVGATGTRLIITLLHELRRQKRKRGLASLCIGGGQGGAFVVEAE